MNRTRDHCFNCRTVLLLGLLVLWPQAAFPAAGQDVYAEWEVKEHFGLGWPLQAVHRCLDAQTASRLEQVRAALEVADETGHVVPAQAVRGESGAEVWYTTDLRPHASRVYRLRNGTARTERLCCALKEEACAEFLNEGMGVRIAWSGAGSTEGRTVFDPPRPLCELPGPVLEVRGPDGQWFGKGNWRSALACKALRCEILENGPVLAIARQRYELENGGEIAFDYQFDSVTPAVRVLQRCTGPVEGEALWRFHQLGRFEPTHAFWRIGTTEAWRGPRGSAGRQVYRLRYAEMPDEISVIPFAGWEKNLVPLWSCLGGREDRRDLLVLGAIRPSKARCVGGFRPFVISASLAKGQPDLTFSTRLQEGQKAFFIGMLQRPTGDPEADKLAPPVESMFRQLHYLGLDEYHHMDLEWTGMDNIRFPHLMLHPDEVEAIRSKFRHWEWLATNFTAHVNHPTRRDWAGAFLATGDPSYAARAKLQIGARLDEWISLMTGSMYHADIGWDRPWRATCVAFDLIGGSTVFTEAERRAFLRKLAFIAEVASTADYWPNAEAGVVRGGKNFHPDYVTAKGTSAALLTGHPRQREWMTYAITEAARFLRDNHFPSGCQEEPSTYQLFTLGTMMVMATAVRNAGGGDLFEIEPTIKKSFEYVAAIQTPKDPRTGFCMLPTIGHVTSYGWSQSLQAYFAWAAQATAKQDPAFSRRMMAAWRRAGAPVISLHDYAGDMIWWQPLCLMDRTLPDEVDPSRHQSRLHAGLGAIFRQRHDEVTEGYLLVKMGPSRSHYDADEGSLIWYAYGQPVLADFGTQYFPNLDTFSWLHNRLGFAGWNEAGNPYFKVIASDCGKRVQYICGEMTFDRLWRTVSQPSRDPELNARLLPGPRTIDPVTWRRHVLYIGACEAVVILDELQGKQPTDWNLQVFAEEARVFNTAVRLKGQFGVDLDVHVALPITPDVCISGFDHLGFDEPLSPLSTWWRDARWTAAQDVCYGPLAERAITVRVRAPGGAQAVPQQAYLGLLLARRAADSPATVSLLPGGEGFEWANARGHWLVRAPAAGKPWKISVEGPQQQWTEEIAPAPSGDRNPRPR